MYFHRFMSIFRPSLGTEINSDSYNSIIQSHKYIHIHRLLRQLTNNPVYFQLMACSEFLKCANSFVTQNWPIVKQMLLSQQPLLLSDLPLFKIL